MLAGQAATASRYAPLVSFQTFWEWRSVRRWIRLSTCTGTCSSSFANWRRRQCTPQVSQGNVVLTRTSEERPLSLDAEVEQKYSLTKETLLNPLKVGFGVQNSSRSYRIGVGYSFTPQSGESSVSVGLRFHLLSFGNRRD